MLDFTVEFLLGFGCLLGCDCRISADELEAVAFRVGEEQGFGLGVLETDFEWIESRVGEVVAVLFVLSFFDLESDVVEREGAL